MCFSAAERMTGEVVEVCRSEDSEYWCKKCGEFSETGKGQWGTVLCGDASKGLRGSMVKVRAKGCVQIATIEIYGISTLLFIFYEFSQLSRYLVLN